jgi:hypothetical protein
MSESNTSAVSVNIDLTKPATVLIEKVAGAIGVVYEPRRIKKRAEAVAESKIMIAKTDAKIADIQQRTKLRLFAEEQRKQQNMESVIEKAIPQLSATADPSKIEDDWITQFFERARLTSDAEMQDIWASLLAGESNNPGCFSRRTVNLVSELEKNDANLFSKLSNFIFYFGNRSTALVFESDDAIYNDNGINFDKLGHLDSLGLIRFDTLGYSFTINPPGAKVIITYGKKSYVIKTPEGQESKIGIGHVMLSAQGQELSRLCPQEEIKGFYDYVKQKIEVSGKTVEELIL